MVKAFCKECTFIYSPTEGYWAISMPRPVPDTGASRVKAAQSFCTGECRTSTQAHRDKYAGTQCKLREGQGAVRVREGHLS